MICDDSEILHLHILTSFAQSVCYRKKFLFSCSKFLSETFKSLLVKDKGCQIPFSMCCRRTNPNLYELMPAMILCGRPRAGATRSSGSLRELSSSCQALIWILSSVQIWYLKFLPMPLLLRSSFFSLQFVGRRCCFRDIVDKNGKMLTSCKTCGSCYLKPIKLAALLHIDRLEKFWSLHCLSFVQGLPHFWVQSYILRASIVF